MAQTSIPPSSSTSTATVADLLEQLGDIPPNRVRLRPAPGTATEKDVIEVESRENWLCELVDGALVEKAIGFDESLIGAILVHLIFNHVQKVDLGVVLGADGMMRLAQGLVRIPDVSFVSWERLRACDSSMGPIPDLAPDLAIEVLSPSNTVREMERKRREYFAAGVRQVWMVEPIKRRIRVYKGPEEVVILDEGATLEVENLLPGFRLPVRELFEWADWKANARDKGKPSSSS